MSKTFAIADLHGRFDLLQNALSTIDVASSEGGHLIILGDFVDRGPHSRQIIERLMAGPSDPRWKWTVLQGNHEALLLQACRPGGDIPWWVGNGGGWTLISYGQKHREYADPKVIPADQIEWIADLPLFHVDDHRVYVHAGVVDDEPLAEQDRENLQWIYYPFGAENGYREAPGARDFHVVHGHHAHKDGPLLYAGRTNLDTSAWDTGRIVIAVFDDAIGGGPIEIIEVAGPTIDELRSAL